MAKRRRTKRKPRSKFKLVLFIYTAILISLSCLFLNYVYNSLLLYDKYDLDTFIKNNLQDGTIAKYYKGEFKANKYETEKVNYKTIAKVLKQDNINYKRVDEKDNDVTYDIYRDKKKIAHVSLSSPTSFKRLIILNIKKWEIKEVQFDFTDGFYQYRIEIPYTHSLYVNDILVDSYEVSNDKSLDRVVLFDKDVGRKGFTLKDFISEPKIEIKDDKDKSVNYKLENDTIIIQEAFPKVAYEDLQLKSEIDVMQLAKNWSLFLSNNLGGARNGLNKFMPYLIEGSYMYEIAARWAKGPEIYDFVPHKAAGFQNESIEACTVYSENSFSCEVKLEKIIILTKNGGKRIDKMHENLFFTYYAGGYKLTDMQSA